MTRRTTRTASADDRADTRLRLCPAYPPAYHRRRTERTNSASRRARKTRNRRNPYTPRSCDRAARISPSRHSPCRCIAGVRGGISRRRRSPCIGIAADGARRRISRRSPRRWSACGRGCISRTYSRTPRTTRARDRARTPRFRRTRRTGTCDDRADRRCTSCTWTSISTRARIARRSRPSSASSPAPPRRPRPGGSGEGQRPEARGYPRGSATKWRSSFDVTATRPRRVCDGSG